MLSDIINLICYYVIARWHLIGLRAPVDNSYTTQTTLSAGGRWSACALGFVLAVALTVLIYF